jgi:DNA mismatch repair protein MutL
MKKIKYWGGIIRGMPIHILPDQIASQIAAGEVIERPASVVKELIENAIDAGAESISIEMRQAGKELIMVEDDGSGIPAGELLLAIARNATSKLEKAEDLFNISTLGFRGEALASIASVARVTVTSRTRESEAGSRIEVDGGTIGKPQPQASPQGTQVRVESLFYNVPARLKFLKADITENRQVTGLATRYAMAYPNIRWKLVQDGKVIFQTTGNGDKREILLGLYGSQDAKALMPLAFKENIVEIDGFVSDLSLTRSNRKDITLFVNGRWVQDPALSASVIKAYNTLLMVGRYPVVILFIRLPNDQVDVNVHPSKAEVRFRNSDQVFSTLQRAIKRGLLAYTPIPGINPASLWGMRSVPESLDPQKNNYGSEERTAYDPTNSGTSFNMPGAPQNQPALPGQRLPLLRLIGQVASTYLIAEGPDGLYLIDQHAAHERVLFDQMMNELSRNTMYSQKLLTPVVIELSQEKAGTLELQLPVLQSLGFELEPFGPNAYRIQAIPHIFVSGDPSAAIYGVLNEFEEDETPLQAEIQSRIAGRVCKRMAVKGGQVLSDAEQRELLSRLETSPNPRTCPHGRPTMIHLSAALLERQFGRTGAI